ncbi:MAG: OsmC family protein [Flavobacteriales bacterium]|nr:OsmC family protein [Flavobacteriales bacterium]
MKHEVEAMWMQGMQFNALVQGHTVVMDAPERVGGQDQGPIPKPFVLSALAGCTGMDVVALLRKEGKKPTAFDLRISGELSKGAPMVYVGVHVVYDVQGDPADEQAVLNVVARSQNEICGVSAMLKCSMPVTWELIYNGRTVPVPQNAVATPA